MKQNQPQPQTTGPSKIVVTRMPSVCEICKKDFIFNSLNSKGRFCSHKCHSISRIGTIVKNAKLFKKGEHPSVKTEFKKGSKVNFKNATVSYFCKICKKEIRDFKSIKRTFCSYKCYWNSISKKLKKSWEDKEYKEKRLKQLLKGLIVRPTGLEKDMINIINRNNLPYKYTGNGDFWIGGKNPDFVNINGEKKLIEVGCEYFKNTKYGSVNNYKKERSKHFAKYGWKSYIFISDKLNEEKILKEINKK